jgi:hypothetical protein
MQRADEGPISGIETDFESAVDQVFKKRFSEFQNVNVPLCGNI